MIHLRIPHTISVCYPRVRHGHSVYRWRRDRLCSDAFHPIHRCGNWVRIAVVSTLDHHNLAAHTSSCSVGALYFYSGDSIRKHTANGLETALGEYLFVPSLSKCSTQMVPTRCIGSFIPILSPEICKGSDSSDAYCHVGCGRRILRQGDIQAKSVGARRVSALTVGTSHCSNFSITCNICTTISPLNEFAAVFSITHGLQGMFGSR